ncbi:MAG: T9SS type A sorting domain-containing protein [candidate division WOR-3 bacterium]
MARTYEHRQPLLKEEKIRIALFDLTGREVEILKEEVMKPGWYHEVFRLKKGRPANGIYFLLFKSEEETRSEKLIFKE